MIDTAVIELSVMGEPCVRDMLTLAAETPRDGCFVEFGVYRGGSAWHLARLASEQARACHLFDTFTGIPERSCYDDRHSVGDFADTDLVSVQALIPSAIFHIGTFPDTMSDIGAIAFAHVDCDQYVSCVAAIEHFLPRMLRHGIMLFDDYGATSGVTKAVDEAFKRFYLTAQGKAYVVSPADLRGVTA
jgi:O-methyltransferase